MIFADDDKSVQLTKEDNEKADWCRTLVDDLDMYLLLGDNYELVAEGGYLIDKNDLTGAYRVLEMLADCERIEVLENEIH